MNRGTISGFFRKLGLSHLVDNVRFNVMKLQNRSKNTQFKAQHPDVKLPPDYLIYESFQMDYEKYYSGGKKTAKWLIDYFEKFKKLENINLLDWGCGPGRTVRHFPELFSDNSSFYGTDVNRKSVKWCSENITGVSFATNELSPPFRYESSMLDVAYAISILTHLSEDKQKKWLEEINRVLKNGGLFLVTTHGVVFETILSEEERKLYKENKIVIRGNVREGHRVYGAFHPPKIMREVFEKNFKILSHEPGKIVNGKPLQDIWVLQKK